MKKHRFMNLVAAMAATGLAVMAPSVTFADHTENLGTTAGFFGQGNPSNSTGSFTVANTAAGTARINITGSLTSMNGGWGNEARFTLTPTTAGGAAITIPLSATGAAVTGEAVNVDDFSRSATSDGDWTYEQWSTYDPGDASQQNEMTSTSVFFEEGTPVLPTGANCDNADDQSAGTFPLALTPDTTGGVNLAGNTCAFGGGTRGNDYWILLPPLTDGNFYEVEVLSAPGSDSVISVQSTATDCTALTEVVCNDDAVGYLSGASWVASAGNTYYLFLESWGSGSSGAFSLEVRDLGVPPATASDDCAGATAVGPVPYSSTFLLPVTHTNTGDFRGSALNTTGDALGRDTFWSFTPATSDPHLIELDYVDASAILGVWTGACGALVEDATVPPQFDNPADGISTTRWAGGMTMGTAYTIVYEDAFSGSNPGGPIDLRIDTGMVPANDECVSAEVVGALPYTHTTDALFATDSGVDTAAATYYAGLGYYTAGGVDWWYIMNAPAAGNYRVTANTADTTIPWYDVFEGGCAGTLHASSSTFFASNTGIFTADGVNDYAILVEALPAPYGTNGPVELQIVAVPPPAPNGLGCASATVVDVDVALPYMDTQDISGSDNAMFLVADAEPGPDIWYQLTSATGGAFVLTADNSATPGGDINLVRVSGACPGTIEEVVDDVAGGPGEVESITVALSPGVPQFVVVNSGTIESGSVVVSIAAGSLPAGNECSSAVAQVGPGMIAVDTTTFFDVVDASCNTGAGGPEAWFALSGLNSGNNYTVETTAGSTSDTALEILDGSCVSLVSIGCNDDIDLGGGNYLSSVSFDATHARGGNYYILAETWSATPGTFGLTITDNGVSSVSDWQLMNY